MSLTLTDLRVRTQHNLLMTEAANPTRPATLDDLIQVLEGMGAKRIMATAVTHGGPSRCFNAGEPGTYLVVPLDADNGTPDLRLEE